MPLFLPISSLVGTVLPELMCYTACTIQVLMCLFVLQHFGAELNCTYGSRKDAVPSSPGSSEMG
jgi:hypothetical protein